ncbi:MAG: hypothetical protein QOG09_1613 [Solirubrobacterales bacterium]|nr:hypothetical protein [Solirubrobacterales bacterium]
MGRGSAAVTGPGAGERQRAAIALIESNGATLKRTARRYSLCADDADDAYQRALELLLIKAPTTSPKQLIRWMQTVTKHEALAVRRNRERLLSSAQSGATEADDPIDLLPDGGLGPFDRAALREHIARSSEALHALKPQEVRALILKAEGYSYAEICEITGWSLTKINRCMAEGRKRFLEVYASIEGGARCEQLAAELSSYCDGESDDATADRVRRHLKGCSSCRSLAREYRLVPERVLSLLPVAPSMAAGLLHRAGEWASAAHSKLLPGADAAGAGPVIAAGGTRGAGVAAVTKILALCGVTAAGGAACVIGGVSPVDLGQAKHRDRTHQVSEAASPVAVHPIHDPPSSFAAPVASPAPPPQADASESAPSPAPEPSPPASPSQEFAPQGPASSASSPPAGGGSAGPSAGAGSSHAGGGAGSEFGP